MVGQYHSLLEEMILRIQDRMLSLDCKEGSNDGTQWEWAGSWHFWMIVSVYNEVLSLGHLLIIEWAQNWKKVSKGFDRPWKWTEKGSDWRYMSRDRDELINLYFCCTDGYNWYDYCPSMLRLFGEGGWRMKWNEKQRTNWEVESKVTNPECIGIKRLKLGEKSKRREHRYGRDTSFCLKK